MDPLSIIVGALVSAAGAMGQVATNDAAQEAYDKLKSLILGKFGSKADVENALTQVETKPDSTGRQGMLKEELQVADAAQDAEVIQQAKVLMELLKELGAGSAPTQHVRERYLRRVRDRCNALPLGAMGGDEEDSAEVTLDRVYVELETTTRKGKAKQVQEIIGEGRLF